jgi:Ser/Thr protein kinase RdoA (MazF antagonist)
MMSVLLHEVGLQFGWSHLQAGPRLRGGEWNEVWRLETSAGPRVLRICNPSTTLARLQYSHSVLEQMSRQLSEVHAPVRTSSGSTYVSFGERLAAVFPLVPGERLATAEGACIEKAARLLAKIHLAGLSAQLKDHPEAMPLRRMDWAANHLWCFRQIESLLAGERVALAAAAPAAGTALVEFVNELAASQIDLVVLRRFFRDRIASLSSERLKTGQIHGDYYPGNVLARASSIEGVIDWDETRREWLVYELGRATWEFCHSDYTLDWRQARQFLEAYRAAGGPAGADTDIRYLSLFMSYTRWEDAMFALTCALNGSHWDAEQNAYHLANLRAIPALLGIQSL